jgi:hypothetical protein
MVPEDWRQRRIKAKIRKLAFQSVGGLRAHAQIARRAEAFKVSRGETE